MKEEFIVGETYMTKTQVPEPVTLLEFLGDNSVYVYYNNNPEIGKCLLEKARLKPKRTKMEKPEQKLDIELREIPKEELVEKCCNILSDICNGGKNFVMTVPPNKNCSDMLLAELINRYRENR